jgi:predicted patatin/cPLA2 family phospholipase
MDFIFNTLPNHLVPFDFDTFRSSGQHFVVTTTDCKTGRAVYYSKDRLDDAALLTTLKAGCSLPFLQKPVHFDGRILVDGGIADAVPLQKSIADGNIRHVLVLTQPSGYRKIPSRLSGLIRLRYPRYPGLYRSFISRARRYNRTMAHIEALEADGAVFVIRPAADLAVKRTESDVCKLDKIYTYGYNDAANCFEELKTYLADRTRSYCCRTSFSP